MRKLGPPVTTHLFQVEVFEDTIIRVLKGHDQRHDFTHTQAIRTLSMTTRRRQQMLLPNGGKRLIKIIQIAKKSYNVHRRAPNIEVGLGNLRVDHPFWRGALLTSN